MEKTKLDKFIAKYTFGGAVESVTWDANGTELYTKARTSDKNAGVEVTLLDASGFPKGSYSVYETKKLKSMLSIVGDDVTITPNVQNNVAKSLEFSSDGAKAVFVLADESVIPEAPVLSKLPPFDLTIELTDKMMNTFLRAKAALSESETFVIKSDGKDNTAQIVLGYSKKNTNRVTISAKTTGTPVVFDPLNFSAVYLKEIFLANKEVVGGTMAVSSRGLCVLTLNTAEYTASYYLVKIDDAEQV